MSDCCDPSGAAPKAAGRAAVALVGTPNCGKTTLFNRLTGLKQKVANYAGVTGEKKEGVMGAGEDATVLVDLPGLYSLDAQTPDEAVARDLLRGEGRYGERPGAVLLILDGSALERSLAFAASVLRIGLPALVVLTMFDEVKARGGRLDLRALERELGAPVLPVVGHRGVGLDALRAAVAGWREWKAPAVAFPEGGAAARYAWAAGVLTRCLKGEVSEDGFTARVDRVVLHPVAGPVVFVAVMALFFQAIFTWAQPLMDLVSHLCSAAGTWTASFLPAGPLRGLVANGLFEGVGSVAAFLPQILILFFFIFLLEDVGYMARAAFLVDRIMGWAGLQGRSFIALLSCTACAVPGIMAARAIPSEEDRLTTMLVAPLMTCSARLPIYAVLIGAFVPDRRVFGPLHTQGLTLLALYFIGAASAFGASWLLRRTVVKGSLAPFYMELPPYRFPALKSILLAMLDRAKVFLQRAGTVILGASLVVWLGLNFPRAPRAAGADEARAASAQLRYSAAGRLGKALEPLSRPLGFDWRVNIGIISSFPAREVIVATLAQIYSVEAKDAESGLRDVLRTGRDAATGRPLMPLPTALSLLAFFVYALQCTSTLAVMRRETNGWRWPAFAFGYLLACAYAASFVVYHGALLAGL
ncbi:MAG: ferrous iron transporter B [Elusimicrobia bacterium]|nr:ferrous iron transporter B [Elusimicrobiota bacterium]